eukprot:4163411-Prymnesium_polylepis.1
MRSHRWPPAHAAKRDATRVCLERTRNSFVVAVQTLVRTACPAVDVCPQPTCGERHICVVRAAKCARGLRGRRSEYKAARMYVESGILLGWAYAICSSGCVRYSNARATASALAETRLWCLRREVIAHRYFDPMSPRFALQRR